MARPRFFAIGPVPDEGTLPLSEADAHHARDVLRLQPGEEIVLAWAGAAWRVRLTEVGETLSGARTGEIAASALPRVTLAQGLPKGDKLDTIVRQVTELGVARIVPFEAERSVVKLDPAKAAARAQRWRRIAEEAAKQSRRTAVPEVLAPVASSDLARVLTGSAVIVCWEDATDAPGIAEALAVLGVRDVVGAPDVAIVIGPEGGLARAEVDALLAAGAVAVSLGDTVLRTETAGVVAPALLLYELGGLGARR